MSRYSDMKATALQERADVYQAMERLTLEPEAEGRDLRPYEKDKLEAAR